MSRDRPLIELELSTELYERLRSSLLPEGDEREHASFLLARPEGACRLTVVDAHHLSPAALSAQSWGYLALQDGALQEMILRAHRAEAALVETHSHPFSVGPLVEFSPFDCQGLSTTAPHVVWRLPGRPYGALVFGQDAFDGLYWSERTSVPSGVVDLVVDGVRIEASRESLRRWSGHGR